MEWVRKESEEVGLKMDGKSNGKVSDNSLDLLDICECYVIFSLLLSRWWYILHYHRSTLLLPLGERLLL